MGEPVRLKNMYAQTCTYTHVLTHMTDVHHDNISVSL